MGSISAVHSYVKIALSIDIQQKLRIILKNFGQLLLKTNCHGRYILTLRNITYTETNVRTIFLLLRE